MKKNLDNFLWWMMVAVIVCGSLLLSFGFIHNDPISFAIGFSFFGFVLVVILFADTWK